MPSGAILKSKKVLVSGGTGFVGAATVRSLADQHPGCDIIILDLSPPRPQHALPKDVEFVQVDVASMADVKNALQRVKPDIVIHTAGIVPALANRFGRRLEREVWRTNVQGTKNMLDAAAECGVKAFIYTSTCCVTTDDMRFPYPNINEEWPTSPTSLIYGESKVVASYLLCIDSVFLLRHRGKKAKANKDQIGCSGGSRPAGVLQSNGDLLSPTLGTLWTRGLPADTIHSRMYC
jgi:sterol-4alpha-carboxylate 3-dehydrogenase (decarboxylating)